MILEDDVTVRPNDKGRDQKPSAPVHVGELASIGQVAAYWTGKSCEMFSLAAGRTLATFHTHRNARIEQRKEIFVAKSQVLSG